jgi:hypothetical protein
MARKKTAVGVPAPNGLEDTYKNDLPEFLIGKKVQLQFLVIEPDGREVWYDIRPRDVFSRPVWTYDGWQYLVAPMGRPIGEPPENNRPLGPSSQARWRWRGLLPGGIRHLYSRRLVK